MVWYKNTIIEVKQHHLDMFRRDGKLFLNDAIAYVIMDRFEELTNVRVYDGVIGLFYRDEDGNPLGVEVKNELDTEEVPFKFIIAENEDDYWGTCTAKNLPCHRVPVQQPMADNRCASRVPRPSRDELVGWVCGAEGR